MPPFTLVRNGTPATRLHKDKQETIMKKFLLNGFVAAAICIGSASAAEVVVKLKPPAMKVEHRPDRPSPQHVWIGGYHRWDGGAYVWEPGRWEVPPREHAVWVAPRWEHRNGGYVFVAGRWK
jgi:WXXGXW repeat (2 copies)